MQLEEQPPVSFLASLLDTPYEGLYIIDNQWRCTYANSKAAQLVGLPIESLPGNTIWQLFPEAIATVFYSNAHRAVKEHIPMFFEVYYPPLDAWFENRLYPYEQGLIVLSQDITERRRQQEQLHFQTTILANIQESVIVTDLQGTITYWNEGARRIFGYSAQEMLGKTPALLYPTLDMHALQADLQQVQAGEDYLGEWQGQRKDGTVVWVDIRTTRLCTSEGQPIGFLGLARDVTKDRQTEALARRQSALLELSTEAIIVWQFQGPILSWNSGAERLYSYTKEEAIGSATHDLLQTQFREPLERLYETLRETGTWEGELRHIAKDGRNLVVESIMVLVTEDDGSQFILEINRDITERNIQKEALRQSQARVRRLIDANLVGVVVADMNGIFEANDAFLGMVGYTREDLEARAINWRTMTPPEFLPLDFKALQELQERGECTPFEKAYYRKDGSLVPILIGAALLEQDPLQWVCFILDISERKALEQRKDDFINMASHELKTPITVLKGLTQLLVKKLEQQAMQEPVSILSRMDAQISRLVRLIDEFLDVSKIQAGRLDYEEEPVDVDALVRETVEMLQTSTPTHTLNVSGATRAIIPGDKDHLSQVLTNLITNAIKYSPQASSVDIVLTGSHKNVSIAVRDYGIGIPKAAKKHIFERFYRVHSERDKAFPGLGMGLYIASEIIKRHGGEITVESEEGKGSTFIVTLPLNT